MITRIHSTTIIVRDQEKALRFYTDVLGWEKRIDNEMGDGMRFLTVAPKGDDTELAPGQPGMFDGKEAGGSTGISLIADDVQTTYEDLKARGVNFTMASEKMPWGVMGAQFEDPDGNEFFLTEEPEG